MIFTAARRKIAVKPCIFKKVGYIIIVLNYFHVNMKEIHGVQQNEHIQVRNFVRKKAYLSNTFSLFCNGSVIIDMAKLRCNIGEKHAKEY